MKYNKATKAKIREALKNSYRVTISEFKEFIGK